jgi:hypothetical protein
MSLFFAAAFAASASWSVVRPSACSFSFSVAV